MILQNSLFGLLFVLASHSLSGFALCVKSSKANLRSGPGEKHAITWVAGAFTPLLELERKGVWIKVKDVDGETHWISAKAVSSKIQCLTVRTTQANLRAGPGTGHPLADYPVANRYFSFEKLDSEEGWYKIRTASGFGPFWVHENLIWQALKVHSIGF